MDRPQVVYLDPMFPHRRKKALVKKEMQLLQQLLGEDLDSADLLSAALDTARERVVVKRPRTALPLVGRKPDTTMQSPHHRFDIYF